MMQSWVRGRTTVRSSPRTRVGTTTATARPARGNCWPASSIGTRVWRLTPQCTRANLLSARAERSIFRGVTAPGAPPAGKHFPRRVGLRRRVASDAVGPEYQAATADFQRVKVPSTMALCERCAIVDRTEADEL